MLTNASPSENQVDYHRRRSVELRSVRANWEGTWMGLADFIEPTRLRLWLRNEMPLKRDKILDSTATFALRTLASGMHSGITSPARPWFRLQTPDPDLREFGPVKTYVDLVERRMREIFQQSNVYTSFHQGYGDLGLFGQSCGLLVEDDGRVVRMQQLTHGTFWLARDEKGVATTLYRRFRWTVQRIVSRFGLKNVSTAIREAYNAAKYDQVFIIWHAVEPRLDRDPTRPDKRNKAFLSNYWEDETNGGDTKIQGLLEESGFDSNPIIAPPWEISWDDNYALSPGQIALGDVKMLQKEQQRKLEAVDKMVRPPMTGPTSMKNNPASLLPGAITYVDSVSQGAAFRPAMEVRLSINELGADIRDVQERINRTFYADLFLMLANMEGIQPRNTMEIAERKEEKLLALGPVLENIYGGQLQPVIDRTFEIMNKRGELPPPPRELEGMDLKIEYISILAQAQKAVATGSIERGMAFVGNLAGTNPEVLDKVNMDQAVDVYFDYLGVPPSIVVSDDDVEKKRQGRRQQQQAAANAEMASQVAPAMKQGADAAAVLSEAAQNPGAGALLSRLGLA